MDWLASNWIWIVLAIGLVAMHNFGHRHSGHRKHRTVPGADARPPSDAAQVRDTTPADETGARTPVPRPSDASDEDHRRHRRHGC